MKICVTGGSGFIGGAVIQELERAGFTDIQNWDIAEPDFGTTSEYVETDLTQLDRPMDGFDYVFHCAGVLGATETFRHVQRTFDVNVGGTLRVLDAMRRYGVMVRPNLLGRWLNPYMISSKTAEQCGLMYRTCLNTRFVSCRFTVVYGPRQLYGLSQQKAIPVFIRQALSDRDLTVYGDGSYKVRLLYVDDAARALIKIVQNYDILPPLVDVTSLCPENFVSVGDLAEKILKLTGSKSSIKHLPMRVGQPADAKDAGADMVQAEQVASLLGLADSVSIEEGLVNTISWYARQNESNIHNR